MRRIKVIEDFNAEDSETCLSNFLFELNAIVNKTVVNNYTYCKSVKNPSCIDLGITNSPMSI